MATKKPAPKKSSAVLAEVSSRASRAQELKWQAESDLRTMQNMAELKNDPSRIRRAEAMLKQQLSAIKSVKK